LTLRSTFNIIMAVYFTRQRHSKFNTMRKLIRKIPLLLILVIAFFLAVAPITQEPHLWQKLKMLFDGSLSKPIDIFDLFLHGTPMVLLTVKLLFMATDKKEPAEMSDV